MLEAIESISGQEKHTSCTHSQHWYYEPSCWESCVSSIHIEIRSIRTMANSIIAQKSHFRPSSDIWASCLSNLPPGTSEVEVGRTIEVTYPTYMIDGSSQIWRQQLALLVISIAVNFSSIFNEYQRQKNRALELVDSKTRISVLLRSIK